MGLNLAWTEEPRFQRTTMDRNSLEVDGKVHSPIYNMSFHVQLFRFPRRLHFDRLALRLAFETP